MNEDLRVLKVVWIMLKPFRDRFTVCLTITNLDPICGTIEYHLDRGNRGKYYFINRDELLAAARSALTTFQKYTADLANCN